MFQFSPYVEVESVICAPKALNISKAAAIKRLKQNLAEQSFLPEEFGIWVVCIPVPIRVCEPARSICLPDKATVGA